MIDPADPRSAFAGLRDKDYAAAGLMVLEGRIVIRKALDCGARIRSLLCVPADEDGWRAESAGTFAVEPLGRAEMADLLGFHFHRGTLALAERPATPTEPPPGHAIALWNVTDPDNLGALIRSAAALGASRIYLGPGCADPFSRKALRASMGCALGLPIIPVAGLDGLRSAAPSAWAPAMAPAGHARPGYGEPGSPNLLAAAALDDDAMRPAELAARAADEGRSITLVLGNEGWGLPRDVVEACARSVAVPMSGGVDSLNVGAAGAILMWELFARPRLEASRRL